MTCVLQIRDILALCRVQHLPSVDCLSVCGMQSMAAADSKHIQHSVITGMPQLQYAGKDVTKMCGITGAGGQVAGGGCLLPSPALPVAGHKT